MYQQNMFLHPAMSEKTLAFESIIKSYTLFTFLSNDRQQNSINKQFPGHLMHE
jgi:hypothetical protein